MAAEALPADRESACYDFVVIATSAALIARGGSMFTALGVARADLKSPFVLGTGVLWTNAGFGADPSLFRVLS